MRRGTYSIVAHDAAGGECGVAVQSHWFSVGAVVSWGRPGVGAVATQSIADPAYGPWLVQGDRLSDQRRHAEAEALYEQAVRLQPDNHELVFWAGLAAAALGDMDTALERVRRAIALQPGWIELLPRLGPDTAPGARAVVAALGLER